MDYSISTTVLILSSCLWGVVAREYNSVLTVPNGGSWGTWGRKQFCRSGYAHGFTVKVEKYQGDGPKDGGTYVNGIRLYCTDGTVIYSRTGPWGTWSKPQFCPSGNLISYVMEVELPQRDKNNVAVTNIQFTCSDGNRLVGSGTNKSYPGPWSHHCTSGYICGLQTKLGGWQGEDDDIAFNDMKFFCCTEPEVFPSPTVQYPHGLVRHDCE
ncbi:vitelline membrane outer layer protein 1-like [Hemicordylus capensis]|uniref:vitelline membrane outer layer protein 1-like n=1 Tax=Hemicordylus capensis TaxID=884348 RepID=UPI002303A22A|nr:vitelline membrane outer layer protein 1-like [Hemicordylus capensis]